MDIGDIGAGIVEFAGDVTGVNKMAKAITWLGAGLIALAIVLVIR